MLKKVLLVIFCFGWCSVYAADIIPAENQIILENQVNDYGPKSKWVPLNSQTSAVLEQVYTFLKKTFLLDPENKNIEFLYKNFHRYCVQFVGTDIKGRPAIHCNFYLAGKNFGFKRDEYVFNFKGGNTFWRVDYDINSGECMNLKINKK